MKVCENGGHFVFCQFEGQGLKIENVIQQIWIQHTQIRVNQVYDKFYYEMPYKVYRGLLSRFRP